jgi:hypothetical protein
MMHFTVVRDHREFFRKHHWIECDGLLSQEDQRRLAEGVSKVVTARSEAKTPTPGLNKAFDKNYFDCGHDLWRQSPDVKKVVVNRNLASIAGELTEQKPLRLGYDTLFPAVGKQALNNPYEELLKTTPTLEEISCLQGIVCGLMLCVSGESSISDVPTSLFSRTPGSGVFFTPGWPLPLHEIYQNPGFTYLLIVYVKSNAVYFAQQGDPHLYDFRNLGYDFGDRLKEPIHPIVYS